MYRICRLANIESRYIRRIGVGRHTSDDSKASPEEKHGCVLVEHTDGQEFVYEVGSVARALTIFGAILSAPSPGKAYFRLLAKSVMPMVDGQWRWWEEADHGPGPVEATRGKAR